MLNNIFQLFANPQILKVFHGANYDMKWLQRDFNIYVVNLFDTGQVTKILYEAIDKY